MAYVSGSEAVGVIDAVSSGLGLPEKAPGGKLRVVSLVGEILRPCDERPPGRIEAGAEIDERHRIAGGHVVGVPPRPAEILIVDPQYAVDLILDRLMILKPG